MIGCSTELIWTQKNQIKYVDTKNQLADTLTKGSFSRDEWNRFLCLFNVMSFPMFLVAIAVVFFLTIGSESRAPYQKEVNGRLQVKAHQWQNQKPMVPAKARLLSLVARNPRSETNSSQDLGYPANPGNADERKEVVIASGNIGQSALRSEVGYSQVSRQENALMTSGNCWHEEQLQKQRDEKAYSNSNSARKLAQSATPKTEFQNMRYTNHQHRTKILQFLQKKLGITAAYSTFSMEALTTNVLIWRMFMSSSMKAAIHLGPN